MNPNLGKLPKIGPWQSRLEPYEAWIRELRSKRKTLRQIAQMLEKEKGLKVSHTAVHGFLKVRRKRKAPHILDTQPQELMAQPKPTPKLNLADIKASIRAAASPVPDEWDGLETSDYSKQTTPRE